MAKGNKPKPTYSLTISTNPFALVLCSIGRDAYADERGYAVIPNIPKGTILTFSIHKAGYITYVSNPITINKNETFVMGLLPAYRTGVVHSAGRSFYDNSGSFFPLGATLFWAIRGWKYEQNRVRENLSFLHDHKWDYIRILGQVNWEGNEIDEDWPDYQDILSSLVHTAYVDYGIRTELTIIGGGVRNPQALVDKIIALQLGEVIQNYEIANEAFKNFPDYDLLIQLARHLFTNTTNLVASSSPNDLAETDFLVSDLGFGTFHLDRTYGDDNWRAVRQPWDLKDYKFPCSHNEPIGPASSVNACNDPIQLAMLRVVGIMCGAGKFVLHNAAGVYGIADPARGRTANLWEMPNIDEVMRAVRNIDKYLPLDLCDWEQVNESWTSPRRHPLNSNGRCNKNYGAWKEGNFICMPCGVQDGFAVTATYNCHIKIYNPFDLILETDIQENQTVALPVGNRAYIIQGYLL